MKRHLMTLLLSGFVGSLVWLAMLKLATRRNVAVHPPPARSYAPALVLRHPQFACRRVLPRPRNAAACFLASRA